MNAVHWVVTSTVRRLSCHLRRPHTYISYNSWFVYDVGFETLRFIYTCGLAISFATSICFHLGHSCTYLLMEDRHGLFRLLLSLPFSILMNCHPTTVVLISTPIQVMIGVRYLSSLLFWSCFFQPKQVEQWSEECFLHWMDPSLAFLVYAGTCKGRRSIGSNCAMNNRMIIFMVSCSLVKKRNRS